MGSTSKPAFKLRYETVVRNCAVEFRNSCPVKWESLGTTNEDGVRFCEVCKTNVYYCETDEQAIGHAKVGHCIAKPRPTTSQLPKIIVGRPKVVPIPSPKQLAAREEFRLEENKTKALRDLKYSNRYCPTCGFPCPDWRVQCRVCGFSLGSVTNTKPSESDVESP
mgnify:CR=1 FL=1